jgi:hypothetical protein
MQLKIPLLSCKADVVRNEKWFFKTSTLLSKQMKSGCFYLGGRHSLSHWVFSSSTSGNTSVLLNGTRSNKILCAICTSFSKFQSLARGSPAAVMCVQVRWAARRVAPTPFCCPNSWKDKAQQKVLSTKSAYSKEKSQRAQLNSEKSSTVAESFWRRIKNRSKHGAYLETQAVGHGAEMISLTLFSPRPVCQRSHLLWALFMQRMLEALHRLSEQNQ